MTKREQNHISSGDDSKRQPSHSRVHPIPLSDANSSSALHLHHHHHSRHRQQHFTNQISNTAAYLDHGRPNPLSLPQPAPRIAAAHLLICPSRRPRDHDRQRRTCRRVSGYRAQIVCSSCSQITTPRAIPTQARRTPSKKPPPRRSTNLAPTADTATTAVRFRAYLKTTNPSSHRLTVSPFSTLPTPKKSTYRLPPAPTRRAHHTKTPTPPSTSQTTKSTQN